MTAQGRVYTIRHVRSAAPVVPLLRAYVPVLSDHSLGSSRRVACAGTCVMLQAMLALSPYTLIMPPVDRRFRVSAKEVDWAEMQSDHIEA